MDLNELALFAGAGGGILGGTLLGWRTVCAVEIEPYAASVLIARQNDTGKIQKRECGSEKREPNRYEIKRLVGS